jgi:putative CocE/NonD family hydrolase
LHLRWFDRWLKGLDNGVEQDKPVKIFVMGIDQWREEESWPLADTRYQAFYLHSAGLANTADGDGLLSLEKPAGEAEDVYRYDPLKPVPTVGGAIIGFDENPLFDQRAVEKRADVLCYTTPPLEHDLEVTGPIKLVLHAASSARDTDFTGKLVDVFSDGRAIILTDGILRARYRKSWAEPELLEPDQVYELHLDLGATANVFRAGHRVRLEVSSSNFPRFNRNTNTGGDIIHENAHELIVAENRIFHDSTRPSHLILPLIDIPRM